MLTTIIQLLVLGTAIICLGSFIYGMQSFFVKPDRLNLGMSAVYVFNFIFGALHIGAITFCFHYNPLNNAFGILLYLTAIFIFWWAISVNRKKHLTFAFSSDLPEHLVTTGPYRWIRHPFYFAYLCAWIAGATAISDYRLLVAFFVTLWLYWRAAKEEEDKFYLSSLNVEYSLYKEQAGMFWPNFFRRQSALK